MGRYENKSHQHKKSKKKRRKRSPSPDADQRKPKHKSHYDAPKNISRSSSREHHHHHKQTQKARSRSYSSEATSSGSDSSDLSEKLRSKQLKLKEDKRKQKELQKINETVEEKRSRRLAKKENKERKKKERMGWDEEYMGYTNTDNPFGDAALHKTFVWNKKLKRDGIIGISAEELEKQSRIKQRENKIELEKVKKRRLERERERQERDEEMQRIQRDKEAAQFEEWAKQEDTFHLQQARLRSKIRIDDGRAKPIDLLAKYVGAEEEDLAVEMHEPYTYLNGLSYNDLDDLIEDIKVYMEIENRKNLDFWKNMITIVEDEMQRLRKADVLSKEHYGDRREGINSAVSKDVESMFRGKTHGQLLALHDQINKKINSGSEGVDIGYWESLLSQLKAHIARAHLRDRHQKNLQKKLFQLKQEQGVESEPLFPIVNRETPELKASSHHIKEESQIAGPSGTNTIKRSSSESGDDSDEEKNDEPLITEEDLINQSEIDYDAALYSPRLVKLKDLEPGTLITDPEEDAKRLEYSRHQLLKTGAVETGLSQEEKAFEREARKGMDDEEAIFSVESSLEQKTYLWSDKYRPRKPRYFNRVHTGFEWNKYNQTHYDMDNPPPKIVQGYKFNIFYPDLIDRKFTPEYFLTPCADDKDFATLRFHSGPPYEDIAFKIVNREWEFSYKKGFRCQFHNNIFQLWFHFKRYRYRR